MSSIPNGLHIDGIMVCMLTLSVLERRGRGTSRTDVYACPACDPPSQGRCNMVLNLPIGIAFAVHVPRFIGSGTADSRL